MPRKWALPLIGDTSECPVKHLDPAMHSFRRVAHFYGRGHLPMAGGVLDQPVRLLELMEIYDGLT